MTSNIKAEVKLQELANAYKTYLCCHGHIKTMMNEMRVIRYKEELRQMGTAIPTDNELAEKGVFNGEGAY